MQNSINSLRVFSFCKILNFNGLLARGAGELLVRGAGELLVRGAGELLVRGVD